MSILDGAMPAGVAAAAASSHPSGGAGKLSATFISSCAADATTELEKGLTVIGFAASAAVRGHTLTVSRQHGVD